MNAAKGPPLKGSRWQILRERFQIESEIPPAQWAEPRPIGDVIGSVLSRLPAPPPSWWEALLIEWPHLVGDRVALHARPGRLTSRALVVFVDTSVWLHEIERTYKARILSALQKRFGPRRIPALLLRLDPDRKAKPPGAN